MEFWAKWFPKIEDMPGAKKLSRQGAYGLLIFAAMYALGIVFTLYFNQSPTDQQQLDAQAVQDQVLGSSLLIPFILFFAYRVFIGKGWLVAGLVLVWFLAEMLLKIASGSTNVGWLVFYVAVAAMMANGIRACWWLRTADLDEGSSPHTDQQ